MLKIRTLLTAAAILAAVIYNFDNPAGLLWCYALAPFAMLGVLVTIK